MLWKYFMFLSHWVHSYKNWFIPGITGFILVILKKKRERDEHSVRLPVSLTLRLSAQNGGLLRFEQSFKWEAVWEARQWGLLSHLLNDNKATPVHIYLISEMLYHLQIVNDSASVYYSDILTTMQNCKNVFPLISCITFYMNSEPSKEEAESLAPVPWYRVH